MSEKKTLSNEEKILSNEEKIKDEKIKNQEMLDEGENMIANGLSSAFLGFDPTRSYNQSQSQTSSLNTLFKVNRWYLISNLQHLLSQVYVEHGIIQTIIDVPVNDALSKGVTIKSGSLNQEDIDELQILMEEQKDLEVLGEALKWTRLFGGGAVIINVAQPFDQPFSINSIKKGDENIKFISADLWELNHDLHGIEDTEAESLNRKLSDKSLSYNYYGRKIHESRVLRIKGKKAPSLVRKRLRGWGFSVLEGMVRSVNQYLKSTDLAFEALDEFKIDVYKFANLRNAMATDQGETKVRQRTQLSNEIKNFLNAIILDSEDDYLQKQLSFTGIAEVMDGIRMQIASDLRMPLTKIFGMSSSGFNSGEDDIENYNSMVESEVRSKCKSELKKIIKIRCQQLFGFVPDDLTITFESLRMLKSTEEEQVKDSKFSRTLQSRQAGEISPKDFKESVNADDLLPKKIDINDETWPSASSDTFNDVNQNQEEEEDQDVSDMHMETKHKV